MGSLVLCLISEDCLRKVVDRRDTVLYYMITVIKVESFMFR